MKHIFLALPLAIVSVCMASMTVSGCKSGNKAATDTVQQATTADTLAFDSIVYQAQPDSAVSVKLVADYPTATGKLADSIRAFIAHTLAAQYLPRNGSDDGAKAYPVYADPFDNGQKVVSHYGEGTAKYLSEQGNELRSMGMQSPHLSLDMSVRKVAETEKYVTYRTFAYAYLGGAHGSATQFCTNIAKPSGKVLTMTVDTLKMKTLQPLLRKKVAQYLKENGDDHITAANVDQYLFLNGGNIPLPACTPCLGRDGVHFIYQQYEIGPYAMGMIQFTVPYSEIESCLTPEALQLVGQ